MGTTFCVSLLILLQFLKSNPLRFYLAVLEKIQPLLLFVSVCFIYRGFSTVVFGLSHRNTFA